MKKPTRFLILAGLATFLGVRADDKEPAPPAGPEIVVVDAKGKEHKVKNYEIVAGTRRLAWLAPAEKPDKPEKPEKPENGKAAPPRKPVKPAEGPVALAFRDDNSTTFVDGVLTLIPLEHLRGLEYDNEEETVTATIAAGDKPEADVKVTGTTKFAQINKLTVEAEVDKGDLGVASVKFLGGVKAGGIKGVKFPNAKAAAAPAGRAAQVSIVKGKSAEKVQDLQALYSTGAGEKLSPILLFKKTIKLDVSKIQKLAASGADGKDFTVTLKDGNEETFTLLESGELDGAKVQLEGFLAKVPGGYKFFPVHTVTEITFDEAKTEPKP